MTVELMCEDDRCLVDGINVKPKNVRAVRSINFFSIYIKQLAISNFEKVFTPIRNHSYPKTLVCYSVFLQGEKSVL